MSAPTDVSPAAQPFEGLEFLAVFEGAPDACLIVDAEGRIVLLNEETENMFGYPRPELIGQSVDTLVPATSQDAHVELREAYMEHPTKRAIGIGRDLHGRRKDGTEIAIEIGLSPVEMRSGRFTLVVAHDITLRRRLRAFGSGLLQGAEEERQRIARELHDDTAQSLAALVLRLQMARRSRDPETRERLLKELHEEIHRTSDGVRRILRGLRPPLLEEAGLVAALRSHLKSALAETEIEVAVEAENVEHLLSKDAKLAVYRIVQEAVSNALRHAKPDRVSLRVSTSRTSDRVCVEVEDDGTGFDTRTQDASGARGLGLVGILERAAILGGYARIDSKIGEGTRVLVDIPAQG